MLCHLAIRQVYLVKGDAIQVKSTCVMEIKVPSIACREGTKWRLKFQINIHGGEWSFLLSDQKSTDYNMLVHALLGQRGEEDEARNITKVFYRVMRRGCTDETVIEGEEGPNY